MRILVTGANGYLGQGIVRQLLDDGNTVIAADVFSDKIDKRAVIKEGSMFMIQNPFEYYERPEILLHLAWRNGFIHDNDSHIDELPEHYHFIKRIIEGGVSRVAVMGTMHEIGFFEGSINETTSCNPQSLYGISKNALRNATSILCEQAGVIFQWLRGYYMVGNACFGNSVFSKILAADKKGQVLFPFTSGLNQCDFLDYDQFCLQTAAAVEQSDITGIINICSGRPQKLSDRVERFLQENNLKIRLDYGKYPDRSYDSKAVWGDSKRIDEIMKNRKVRKNN